MDRLLFKFFGSEENIKDLENLKEAKIIFSYLNKTGEESKVRFVGGCVRKAICGETIDDIDLATIYKPNELKEKLNKENIRIIDTGTSHGTLTIIINNKKFEITTLRKDVDTDGRHAKIEFTSDWIEDSLRRDLSINSIYADINGQIFDPQNGINDLKNGIVRFIGSSEKRIKEDYLRIIRFFRFFAQYSKTDFNKETIQSIKKNINGINQISKERIFEEIKKILSLKNVYVLFSNKNSREIFINIFPQFKYYERLKFFNSLDKGTKNYYDYKLILALLIIDNTNDYEFFCYKYKISNEIKKIFKSISLNYNQLKNKKFYSETNIKKLIYFTDKNTVRNILLFSGCANNKFKSEDFKNILSYVNNCKIPRFPISGDDLKKNYGYESGKELGKKLKYLEKKWIENNFTINKEFLKKSLN